MTGGSDEEEAAWRDLVARFGGPAVGNGMGNGAAVPWPDREGLPAPPLNSPLPGDAGSGDAEQPGSAGPGGTGTEGRCESGPACEQAPAVADPIPGVMPAPPQIRVIRPAAPVPPPAADDDEHYVPPSPPPLPPLDPLSKGAWAALFGGPGYLLVAVMAGWAIPGWAALCAVAAFIGGFATLVARMGDRPPGDSGPDNGAVV